MGDRDEITALVHRYAELLDGGDLDAVVALFAHTTWRSAGTGAVLPRRRRSAPSTNASCSTTARPGRVT